MSKPPQNVTVPELWKALESLVKLQRHYGTLLNMHDGGQRRGFKNAREYLARLAELRKLRNDKRL
jgi:hypothetical protein